MNKYHKFDKDYASNIGIKKAVILEFIKEKSEKVMISNLVDELNYLSPDEILESLYALEDMGFLDFDKKKETVIISDSVDKVKTRTPRANKSSKIDKTWRPSDDALEILYRSGMEKRFIDSLIDEFIVYWSEKSSMLVSYNSKFIEYCRLKWAQHTAEADTKSIPRVIESDWQPSEDCLDIIQMTGIDSEFVKRLLPEFILYWKEDGRAFVSWDIKFLDFIKNKWNYNVEVMSKEHTYKFDLYDPYKEEVVETKNKSKRNLKDLRNKYKI